MKAKKNIIIAGYPKSGCTWITRLTAELIDCPVSGFWKSNRYEIACEGDSRVSDYRCYKSHHQFDELRSELENDDSTVIYVIRDPRDVAVSGSEYFALCRFSIVQRLLSRLPKAFGRFYKKHFIIKSARNDTRRLKK